MYQYDVALSYESGLQDFVQEVASTLAGQGCKVFFAPDRQKEMLSANLKSKLYQVYQNESLVKVLFVTDEYLESEYTQLEMRRSVSSSREDTRRLIVVNFIGKKLPKELQPFVYLEGNSKPDDVVFWVDERVKELKAEENTQAKRENRKEENKAGKDIAGNGKEDNCKAAGGQKIVYNQGGIVFGDNASLNHVDFGR